MILIVWLIVWLICGTPAVDFTGQWNNWAIALVVCGALELLNAGRAAS